MLSEALIERDEGKSGIFIRKQLKSKHSQTGRAKATERIYNNYHCCFVCKHLSTNINKHFLSHKEHPKTLELRELKEKMSKEMNPDSKEKLDGQIKNLQTMLRHQGDHQHNMYVHEQEKGELIISRKSDKFKASEYGPCPHCLEWLKLESFKTKHLEKCPGMKKGGGNTNRRAKKGEIITASSVIKGEVNEKASTKLVKEVYPIMTRDTITNLAKGDPLIVALGNNWLRRNLGNTLKRKYYTSSIMHMKKCPITSVLAVLI